MLGFLFYSFKISLKTLTFLFILKFSPFNLVGISYWPLNLLIYDDFLGGIPVIFEIGVMAFKGLKNSIKFAWLDFLSNNEREEF